MTTEGIDFSDSRPGGAAIAAAGKTFVIRYVPYQITRNGVTSWVAKGLTAAEVADYQAQGLAIALVFESTVQRALSGQAAGAADARTASYAAGQLGFPTTSAIYFAVDFDVADAQLAAVDAYLRGAAMILGADRIGVYGGRRVVAHCKAAGSARWLWQTYAWSYGTVVPAIHLYQHLNGQAINGGSVDLDRAMQADFGQWAAPLSGGIFQEDDVTISAVKGQDWKAKYGILRAAPDTASATLVVLPVGSKIRSIAEVSVLGSAYTWRLTEYGGKPAYLTARKLDDGNFPDWEPVVDAAVDQALTDYIARAPAPVADCTSAVKAATDPLNAQITADEARIAAAKAALA